MQTPVYVLGNNSQQPVSINYQAGDVAVEGDVPQAAHGLLTIAPGKKVTIVQNRVNFGQGRQRVLHHLHGRGALVVGRLLVDDFQSWISGDRLVETLAPLLGGRRA